jgi:polyhydroxyalkanoate synthesis regulator phasin
MTFKPAEQVMKDYLIERGREQSYARKRSPEELIAIVRKVLKEANQPSGMEMMMKEETINPLAEILRLREQVKKLTEEIESLKNAAKNGLHHR